MAARRLVGVTLDTAARRRDRLDARTLRAAAAWVESWPGRPLISVVMPAYSPPEPFFARAIASVVGQVYDRWELCVADDASPHPVALPADPRIRLIRRDTNGHISAATNSALALATGEWVAFLDQDDELAPLALLLAAQAIRRHSEAEIVYTDEDKIDADGRPFEPARKPGWNPDLLLSQNYLNHLTLIRRSRIDELRSEFDGSQDYDLLLRVTAGLRSEQVVHVPHIAYHWRALPTSAASGSTGKDYAGDAAIRALDAALAGEATARRTSTERFLGYELDPPAAPAPRVVRTRPGEVPAWDAPEDEVLLFLAEDADVPARSAELSAHLARPGVGAVGGRLLSADGRIVDGALWLGCRTGPLRTVAIPAWQGIAADDTRWQRRSSLNQTVDALSLSFLAVRAGTLRAAGGFRNLPAYADVDLCLRLRRQGLRCLWLPHVTAVGTPRPRPLVTPERLRLRHPELRRRDPNVPAALRLWPRDYYERRFADPTGKRAVRQTRLGP